MDTRSETELRADLSYLFDKASQVLTSRTAARIVQTTPAGDQVVERGRTMMDEVYAEVLGALPDPARETLLDALVRLVGAGGPLNAVVAAEVPRRRPARSGR